tara:strand:+ start:17552 stop:17680 length:129 start_codon:yes stop_codon:yes gene_type:complete
MAFTIEVSWSIFGQSANADAAKCRARLKTGLAVLKMMILIVD